MMQIKKSKISMNTFNWILLFSFTFDSSISYSIAIHYPVCSIVIKIMMLLSIDQMHKESNKDTCTDGNTKRNEESPIKVTSYIPSEG